jgi:hypothetical protein
MTQFAVKSLARLALIALCVAAGTSCGVKRSTSIIVSIETDLAMGAWTEVVINGLGQDSTAAESETFGTVQFTPMSRRTGMPSLPGTVVYTAQREQTQTLLLSFVVKNGGTELFRTSAQASFVRADWQQIVVALPAQCRNAMTAMSCSASNNRTCGSTDPANPCVPVLRTQRSPEQDASSTEPNS